MLVALAVLALAPQQVGAKLVMPTAQGTTVINYPSMQRCLAAKEAMLRQAREQAQEERSRGIILFAPTVYCLPG